MDELDQLVNDLRAEAVSHWRRTEAAPDGYQLGFARGYAAGIDMASIWLQVRLDAIRAEDAPVNEVMEGDSD